VITYGLQTGWISPLQPVLQSKDSPLGRSAGPLSDDEISWIAALPSISLVFSSPIISYCLDRYGRKLTMLLVTAPNIITYLLLIFANDVYFIYVSRLIGGFCACSGFMVSPIYVSETALPKLRGKLGSLSGFFTTLGLVLSFTFGAYTSYLTLNLMSVSFTVFFLLGYYFTPESPVFLLKTGKHEEAMECYEKLWGTSNKHLISKEIEICNNSCEGNLKTMSTLTFFKQLLIERHLRKAFLIVLGVFGFEMLGGFPFIIRYTVDIFERADTIYSPYLEAIVLSVCQLIFSMLGSSVIDKLGRKRLLVWGLTLMGLLLGMVAIYLHLKSLYPHHYLFHHLRYFPTICLASYISLFAAVFCTVFVIIPELFSPETRAVASSLMNLWSAFVEFLIVKICPLITNSFNLSATLAVLGVFGVLGAIYLQVLMFETKGLDFDVIQRKLKGKDVDQFTRKEIVVLKNMDANVNDV